MTTEKKVVGTGELFSLPRGIKMLKFERSDGAIALVGQYCAEGGNPGSRPKRVYKIDIHKIENANGETLWWVAVVKEDDSQLVELTGMSKWPLVYAALGALRNMLHYRCVYSGSNRALKRRSKAQEAAAMNGGAQDQGKGVVAAMLIGGAEVLAVWAILGQLAAALLERVA